MTFTRRRVTLLALAATLPLTSMAQQLSPPCAADLAESATRSLPCLALEPGDCNALAAESAAALVTDVHEAENLAGHLEETAVECHALQDVDRFAEELGMPPAEAAVVGTYGMSLGWTASEYASPECRSGGALDDDPATPVFP